MKTPTSPDEKPVLSSRCPKCGKTTPRAVAECKHCGIIYSRYIEVQRKKQAKLKKQQSQAADQAKSGKGLGLIQVLIVIAVISGGTYYYFSSKNKSTPNIAVPTQVPAVSQQIEQDDAAPVTAVTQEQVEDAFAPDQGGGEEEAGDAGDVIARARKATVSLETPFGTGSGFFISSNYIITNKHVVEADGQQIERLRAEIEPRQELIDLEKKK